MTKDRSILLPALAVAAGALAVAGFAAAPRAEAPGAEQAAEGQKLYGKYCAKCHGDAGQGTKKAPPVVGKDALPLDPPATAKVRKTQFRTAGDVLDFIAKTMPGNKPGSLTPAQYQAILAFDLKANGVDVSKKAIDAEGATAIVLHP